MQHAHNSYGCQLHWLSSVCWARTLDTLKWDILATHVAVYFDSKLRKVKFQTYQGISPAKVREKPPDNSENGVWREGKFPSLTKMLLKREGGPHFAISISWMTETPATKYWV